MVVHVYGVDYELPKQPRKNEISGYNLPKEDQVFYRRKIPSFMDEVYINDEGITEYTKEQKEWIDKELDYIEYGYWFYNNGKPTYITGLHYFYLNYWTLEDDVHPDYRTVDRLWFYFQDYCKKHTHIDGIIRSKKRREGATSQASASLVLTAISNAAAYCGIVSKGGGDARDVFLKMVRHGFFNLPAWIKPQVEDEESKTELSFNRPKQRAKQKRSSGVVSTRNESMGLGSRIDYKTTNLNSYDSGRMTEILIDEGGKFPAEVPINEYWPIVQQTLRKGGVRVGFALMPSTSNKLEKGGKGFKILWDESNQFEAKDGITGSGLYRYFSPAYEGLLPYIDKYGDSIVDTPTPEQAEWMKQKYNASDLQCSMGAKAWLEYQLSLKKDEAARREFKRMHPFTEKDAFDYEDGGNIYPMDIIAEQKERLNLVRPEYTRVSFFRTSDGKVDYVEREDGEWLFLKELMIPKHLANNSFERGGEQHPANTHLYTLSADPFKNVLKVGKGSLGCGIMWSKLNPLDPENTGMPIGLYLDRPKLKNMFHNQMLLCSEYFGADMCYESDLNDFLEFLIEQKKIKYAKEKPKSVIDPTRKKKTVKGKDFGVQSGNSYEMNMMIERSLEYVYNNCSKIWFKAILDDLEEYDPTERTLYDVAAAFQVGCIAISDFVQPKKKTESKSFVKIYQLNIR